MNNMPGPDWRQQAAFLENEFAKAKAEIEQLRAALNAISVPADIRKMRAEIAHLRAALVKIAGGGERIATRLLPGSPRVGPDSASHLMQIARCALKEKKQ